MRKLIMLILIPLSFVGLSQPSTEVYLFEIDGNALRNPINISKNEGYDNQPAFWPDNKSVLYARNVIEQTEIARYFINSGKTKLISNTPQGGEYSPTPMPGTMGISSVRLDTTGLQLLYAYDLEGNYRILVDDLKIGYHAWISDNEIVTFVLGDPATMQVINTDTGVAEIISENIGRSLHKIPNTSQFSFIDKSIEPWQIKRMNLETGTSTKITDVIGGAEDYCWSPDSTIRMGFNSTVYELNEIEGWLPLWDLGELFNIQGNITRLTFSSDGNYLAVAIGD